MKSNLIISNRNHLLLLTCVISVKLGMLSDLMLFRKADNLDHNLRKVKLKIWQHTNHLKRLILKIQIRLLRWLSTLQFPACPPGMVRKRLHYTFSLRTQTLRHKNDINKTFKINLLKNYL